MSGGLRDICEVELKNHPGVAKLRRAYTSHHHEREDVVHYILQVGENFGMSQHTTWTAMYYFDRVMLAQDSTSLMHVEQLALTCLLIAAKFIECESPMLDDLCHLSQRNISRNMLKHIELEVLGLLSWNLQVPSPHLFVQLLIKRARGPAKEDLAALKSHTYYFIDLSVHDISFYAFPMQMIATASLVCASLLVLGSSKSKRLAPVLCAACRIDKEECQRCISVLIMAHRTLNSTSSVFAPIKESSPDDPTECPVDGAPQKTVLQQTRHSPDTVVDLLAQ